MNSLPIFFSISPLPPSIAFSSWRFLNEWKTWILQDIFMTLMTKKSYDKSLTNANKPNVWILEPSTKNSYLKFVHYPPVPLFSRFLTFTFTFHSFTGIWRVGESILLKFFLSFYLFPFIYAYFVLHCNCSLICGGVLLHLLFNYRIFWSIQRGSINRFNQTWYIKINCPLRWIIIVCFE